MTPPFRIAIMMTGGRGWIGGTEYIKNLVLALGYLPTAERKAFDLSLIVEKELDEELRQQFLPCLDQIYLTSAVLPKYTFLNRLRWALLYRLLKYENLPFYDFLLQKKFDFIYPFFVEGRQWKKFPCATWIPDFQHKYLPQYFSSAEIASRDESFGRQALLADTMVLSSNSAAQDYRKFYPNAAAEAKIIQFRTSPDSRWFTQSPAETQKKYNLPDRFFMVSNQFWQHKNHLAIFNALKQLQDRWIKPVVVCTGHIYDYRQPSFSDVILETIHTFGLSDQVKLLGLIPRLDQIQLMRRSLAVIQPSLFEGWSTVVEDARVLGKAMVLSDFSVHVEQGPPGAKFFAKESPEELAQILEEWWQSLPAGPNLEQEAVAREKNKEERNVFARNFLSIARDDQSNSKGDSTLR